MAALISENMRILRDMYGFDTVAARKECLRLAAPLVEKHVLDIGTGSGWMAMLLAMNGARVVSVDLHHTAIVRARERAAAAKVTRRITFVQADVGKLPFPPESFEAVYSFDAMHHMTQCNVAIGELIRVCRHDGRLVVADLNSRGLLVVRAVVGLGGESHYENECRLDQIGEYLDAVSDVIERYDSDFVTAFLFKPRVA